MFTDNKIINWSPVQYIAKIIIIIIIIIIPTKSLLFYAGQEPQKTIKCTENGKTLDKLEYVM